MSKTIIYFVDDISTSFVINDIRKVSERFNNVILLSTEKLDNRELLPNNIKVIESFIEWRNYNWKKTLIAHLYEILSVYFIESRIAGKLLPFKKSIALICSNVFKAGEVRRQLQLHLQGIDKPLLMYSFWFYDCIYLAFLKKWKYADKVVCRAHGGDLFEERSSLKGITLYRNFQLQYIDFVFSVSEIGANYLRKKYLKFASKIKTSYLGSPANNKINTIRNDAFVLVSCANIRDIKRIYLIAETLMHIDFQLVWYHIGDENLNAKNDPTIKLYIDAIENLKSKNNIKYFNLGQLSSEEIFNFYEQQQINLFISLSATEGIPVSMMEAISFGIPVLSTDVGGCNEIVNKQTGILIPLNSKPIEIALTINKFRDSELNSSKFRNHIHDYWNQNFNADQNYIKFFKQIDE